MILGLIFNHFLWAFLDKMRECFKDEGEETGKHKFVCADQSRDRLMLLTVVVKLGSVRKDAFVF